jgi:hypothetical protein
MSASLNLGLIARSISRKKSESTTLSACAILSEIAASHENQYTYLIITYNPREQAFKEVLEIKWGCVDS